MYHFKYRTELGFCKPSKSSVPFGLCRSTIAFYAHRAPFTILYTVQHRVTVRLTFTYSILRKRSAKYIMFTSTLTARGLKRRKKRF